LGERWPELAIVALGIALRVSMGLTFDYRFGYDVSSHMPYILWFVHKLALPPLDLCRETYHPPLYYFIAGMLLRLGLKEQALVTFAAFLASARLLILWYGLEAYLPGRTLIRRVALTLAAILPVSVHLDGMVGGESLNNLLSMLALALAPRLFAGPSAWRFGGWLGLILGLELLTKISALVVLGAIGIGAGFQLLFSPGDLRERGRRAMPFLLLLAVLFGVAGGYFMRNQWMYGKPFLAGFDGPDRVIAASRPLPSYLLRRPPAFYFGWSSRTFQPCAPRNQALRLFPALIASTFADYYNFRFAPMPPPGTPALICNYRPLRPPAFTLARWSQLAGCVIAVATFLSWLAAVLAVLRARRADYLVLLAAPLLALIGQVHFATVYPWDSEGVLKGAYLQFTAGPLFALFGLAVAWLWERRSTRLPAVLLLAALVPIASYTLWCRVIVFL
jgi:hypothetical protein